MSHYILYTISKKLHKKKKETGWRNTLRKWDINDYHYFRKYFHWCNWSYSFKHLKKKTNEKIISFHFITFFHQVKEINIEKSESSLLNASFTFIQITDNCYHIKMHFSVINPIEKENVNTYIIKLFISSYLFYFRIRINKCWIQC